MNDLHQVGRTNWLRGSCRIRFWYSMYFWPLHIARTFKWYNHH